MKKIVLAAAVFISAFSVAQTKFEKAMSEKIGLLDSAKTAEQYIAAANDFARIGDAEKTQWLPYYYAALAQLKKGRSLMVAGKTADLDPIADEADRYIALAQKMAGENAEIYILQKMSHSLRMMVNPMTRFMTEGAAARKSLAAAEQLDPKNPRILLLKAEDTYHTPPQFGGSKEEGLNLFRQALAAYNAYPSKGKNMPNWGKDEAEYFIKNKP